MVGSQQKTYLDTPLLEKHTGVSTSTWEKRRLTGDTPPYIKVGKRVLYDLAAVDAWLAARTRQSTSDISGA